jgi:hypothetical protein
MSPEQIRRLREMAAQRLGEIAFLKRHIKEPNAEGLERIADLLSSAADIAEAYRWRPVAELTEETEWEEYEIIWGAANDDGIFCTATGWSLNAAKTLGYTHFMRLPKLEAR